MVLGVLCWADLGPYKGQAMFPETIRLVFQRGSTHFIAWAPRSGRGHEVVISI
jgi:hypothetical protein